MKKSILFFACVVITTIGYAQTSPGSMMLGGGLNFASRSYQNGNDNASTGFTLSPSFGYFVGENFAVGASLSIGSSRDGTGDAKNVQTSFGIGPFARYYMFTGSNEKFAFFGQAQFAYSTAKSDPSFGNVTKSSAVSFALSPGAAFFFNEHWALEFSVGGLAVASRDPNKDNDNDKYTDIAFGLNSVNPNLGFRYHF